MRRCDFPLTLAVAVLAIALTALAPDTLVADGRVFHGQWWRLASGPFIHATWGHLIRDLSLVALAGIPYEARLGRSIWILGLVVPPLVALGTVDWYCGLSGLSHALLAGALAHEALRRRGRTRIAVLGLCAIAALKPIYELATGAPAFPMALGDHVVQVPIAHAAGVVIGIACASRNRLAADDRARPLAGGVRRVPDRVHQPDRA
jgi:rhomboid family GlyGly-CTERM serine protease